ncbi:uncharacterized protein LOC131313848 [Rhododendron vialii]|uniref:uncharacterized protein LOC131313848 n=1 Tax=Rhododendron vialii TaxID=182163 RepID=UPI0026603CF4|nr:uncharacterized protein LOC131313848 [Rhododendron vialii]
MNEMSNIPLSSRGLFLHNGSMNQPNFGLVGVIALTAAIKSVVGVAMIFIVFPPFDLLHAGPMLSFMFLEIHHGGVFTAGPNRAYVRGKIDVIDGIDSDLLSLIELEGISQHLGYGPHVTFHYRVPGLNLDIGLVHMKSDADVVALVTSLPPTRIAELYVEHIGGVKFLESQTGSCKADDLVINIDDLFVDEAVILGEEVVHEEELYSDESTEDEMYSDGSYSMSNDETFVDDEVEFRGIGESSQKNVPEDNVEGEEIVLSDAYYDTEDGSAYSSSDDDNNTKKIKEHQFKKFRIEHDNENLKFEVGMKFSSAADFKVAVKQHAIKNQRNVKFVKNDKTRVRARCQTGCPWEMYAHKVLAEESFQLRTYRPKHKCLTSYTNRNVNSSMIAKRYMDDLRINPSMPIKAFKERVRKEMKVDVSKSQLYRAKRKAAMLIYGDDIEQYGRLWDYCEELRRSNSGSTIVMDAPLDEETGQPRFNRLYICFAACKSGFIHGCRKLIGVDGCHLKGLYVGQLLTAIGVDPNDAMYPIAYAVVEKENKDTWMWFFELLRIDLGITPSNEPEFTFINDRQKGLLPALVETFQSAEHRHCCKHLLNNFMKIFKGPSLEEKFWKCVKATHVAQFQYAMEVMNKENPDTCKWLKAEPARYWSRSHFKDIVKCDMVCNNMCEAFNKAILDARDKSITEMLEWIRSYLVNRRVIRREWIRRLTDPMLTNIYNKLEKFMDESNESIADWCGELNFQVRCPYGQYTVDLGAMTCSCRKWDLCGIPCPHAIAAIENRQQQPEEFVKMEWVGLAMDQTMEWAGVQVVEWAGVVGVHTMVRVGLQRLERAGVAGDQPLE